ncbi:hypothetical protein VIGAN_08334100 [Vigna angularis var. angularis]|uniref:AP2/ERF domain-containing protein n=1 Tax=Vigna angularis var. angularis TaxID=157739 RepID=A0A0S3SUB8_PHAAN|nr:hypothetical protein VIGAN_08334100 [Vigna angularis var. angularis]
MEPSKPRYPKRGRSSRGLWNSSSVTLNFTKNEVLIPVQGSQFPSNLIAMEHASQQTSVVASQTIEFGVQEQVKQKRYRKRNFKKTTSMYRGVTRCKGRFESFVWDKDLKTTGKRGKTDGASAEVQENNVDGDALSNPESTTMQSVFDEIGQQSQAVTTSQDQHENVAENNLLYADQFAWLDFDLSSSLWSYDFDSAQVQDHADALGNNALNWESSTVGAGNGSVASSGSMEPNILQFDEQNPHAASVHRYEPLQYGFATSNQNENVLPDNDWDITQYLNLDYSDMVDHETTDD